MQPIPKVSKSSDVGVPQAAASAPQYKDHLTIKTTLATAKRWYLYQGSTVHTS